MITAEKTVWNVRNVNKQSILNIMFILVKFIVLWLNPLGVIRTYLEFLWPNRMFLLFCNNIAFVYIQYCFSDLLAIRKIQFARPVTNATIGFVVSMCVILKFENNYKMY